jgi:hypothetical protein
MRLCQRSNRVRQTFAMDLTERKLARVVEVARKIWG